MEWLMRHIAGFIFVGCLLVLAGCVSAGSDAGQRILGTWRASIAGYPVTVRYTRGTVQVDGAKPVAYSLDGNRLTFPGGGHQVRIVSFPSRGEMVETDPLTGAKQHYTRVAASH